MDASRTPGAAKATKKTTSRTAKRTGTAVATKKVANALGDTFVESQINQDDSETGAFDDLASAEDKALIRLTLRQIMTDPTAPAAAKAQAARTLAEMVGQLGRNAKPPSDGKPVGSLTRAEIMAELASIGG